MKEKARDISKIQLQCSLCQLMMSRLYEEIIAEKELPAYGMQHHSRKRDDIKRLRRELQSLSTMLDPWGEQK